MFIKITSENRNAARKLLTFCGTPATVVRTMTLTQLSDALQRAINQDLITKAQVDRMLGRDDDNWKNEDDSKGNGTYRDEGDEDEAEFDQESDDSSNNGSQGDDKSDDGDGENDSQENGDGDDSESSSNSESENDSETSDGNGDSDSEDSDESDEDGASNSDSDDDGEDEDDSSNGDDGEKESDDGNEDDDESQSEDDNEDESSNEDENNEDENEDEQEQSDEHESLPSVLKYIRAGLNVALVGPAGTGKSYIARQVAAKLEKPFYVNGAMMSKYDLIGYNDAHGTYHATPAHDAFKFGGVHLFDELDASAPDAVVAFNGMTDDQPFFTFPCGQVEQHPDYVAIAAMNTWGNGASADYVGRYKQDAASMTRFVKVFVGYDRKIEAKIAGKHADIRDRVWALRESCEELGIRHIVSTRMIVQAVDAREKGKATKRELDRDIFFAGLDDNAVRQLKTKVNAKLREDNGND